MTAIQRAQIAMARHSIQCHLDAADRVDLGNILDWQTNGQETIDGLTYDVFEHVASNARLLIATVSSARPAAKAATCLCAIGSRSGSLCSTIRARR